MNKIKLTALLLSIFLSMQLMISCTGKKEDIALSFNDEKGKVTASMSKSMYSLWLSFQKSMYSYLAKTDEAWSQKLTDKPDALTLGEFVKLQSTDSAKKLVIGSYLFDKEFEAQLTGIQKDEVTAQINEFKKSLNITTDLQLAEYLSTYGADAKTLNEYYTLLKKYDVIFNHMYGKNGIFKISEDSKKDYFEKNYALVEHIFINVGTKSKNDGTSIALTESEIAEQTALADIIMKKINAGEDFKELQKIYSQDAYGLSMYPDGFYVTNDNTYTKEFQEAALSMKVGEIRRVESTQNGKIIGIHIMKKFPLDKEQYSKYDDVLQSLTESLSAEAFNKELDKYMDKVLENKEVTDLFDMKFISSLS